MKLRDIFGTAWANLTRRKVRTFLTALGVTVGIFTIVVMVSLGVGVKTEIDDQFRAIGLENVFVQPRSAEPNEFTRYLQPERLTPITAAVIEELRQRSDVVSVRPLVDVNSAINKRLQLPGNDSSAVRVRIDAGVGINNPFELAPTALAGLLQPDANGTIIISLATGRHLGLTGEPESWLNQPVEILLESPRGESQTFSYTIAGIFGQTDEDLVQLTAEDSLALKAWWFNDPNLLNTNGYDSAVVRTTDINAARKLATDMRTAGFQVQSVETIIELASRIFLVINIMLGSVGGLALFVAAIGITNTMVMAIYERTREIGTLKAIGASRSNVRTLFMTEAGMIGLLGGLIGLFFGWLAGLGLNRLAVIYLEREQVPLDGPFFLIPWWLIVGALGFALLIGILAGMYPAARAARLDPIKALRHE